MSKVAIVGMGRVGSAFAYSLGITETVDQILAVDHNKELAEMQVRDLSESFIISGSKTRIEVNEYTNFEDVDVIVITAGAPVTKVVNRLELFESSKKIVESVVESSLAAGFKGIFLLASNPVDVMTEVTRLASGFEHNKVLGSGTILDNARLQNELSKLLNIDPKYIDSTCIGEHGTSIVPLYSQIKINGQLLDEYLEQNDIVINFDNLTKAVVTGGTKIFSVKGATEFGIASSLTKIVKAILSDSNEVMTVSNLQTIEGIGQVYIPSRVAVGKDGYHDNHTDPKQLSKVEADMYLESAKVLNSFKSKL